MNPETSNIHVTVQDNEENPIEGANVTVNEITSTTGSQGGCNLTNVPVGSQTINVTAEGYDEYSETINVSSTANEFTITLTEV